MVLYCKSWARCSIDQGPSRLHPIRFFTFFLEKKVESVWMTTSEAGPLVSPSTDTSAAEFRRARLREKRDCRLRRRRVLAVAGRLRASELAGKWQPAAHGLRASAVAGEPP